MCRPTYVLDIAHVKQTDCAGRLPHLHRIDDYDEIRPKFSQHACDVFWSRTRIQDEAVLA